MRVWFKVLKRRTNNKIIDIWKKYLRQILIVVLSLIIGITATSCYLMLAQTKRVTISLATEVSADEGSLVTAGENQGATFNLSSSGEDYQELLTRYFGDKSKYAMQIMECESQFGTTKIGDNHLSFWHEGELLGRSIGLMQIRTGGNDNGIVWNRAKANGMTVEEFEAKMKIPEENIKYARSIYDRSGGNFGKWTCNNKIAQK